MKYLSLILISLVFTACLGSNISSREQYINGKKTIVLHNSNTGISVSIPESTNDTSRAREIEKGYRELIAH